MCYLVLLFDPSQILSFNMHTYTQECTIWQTSHHTQLFSSVIHSLKVSEVSVESVVLLTAEDGLHQSGCIKSHFFSPVSLSLSPTTFISVLLTLSHPLLPYVLPICPSPFLYFLLSSPLRPHRPSLTPVRCVAPPPAWSTGVQAGVWGWTTTPWRGWCLRRGDTEEDADTGTGVTVPHSAPWPDTPTQTRVSHSKLASLCMTW